MKKILTTIIFILSNMAIVMAKPTVPTQSVSAYGYLSVITFFIGIIWIFFGVLDLIKALKEQKKISTAVIKLLIGVGILFICEFMEIVETSKYHSPEIWE